MDVDHFLIVRVRPLKNAALGIMKLFGILAEIRSHLGNGPLNGKYKLDTALEVNELPHRCIAVAVVHVLLLEVETKIWCHTRATKSSQFEKLWRPCFFSPRVQVLIMLGISRLAVVVPSLAAGCTTT